MALLEVRAVTKHYRRGSVPVTAVDRVSLSVEAGETLGLIGESGAGKSSLGRIALGLIAPDAGSVVFAGEQLSLLGVRELRRLRARTQVVFQEPFESLDPRMRVLDIVGEPLEVHRRDMTRDQRRRAAKEVLDRVGLRDELWDRRPAGLSGGEQQRVGIARAIVSEPDLLLLDEPTSSLDLSLRAGILQLLLDLQRERGLAYLLVSHDMATIEYVADRVAVMYKGRIVEEGAAAEVINSPRHPYTRLLMDARLPTDPRVRHRPAPPLVARPAARGPGGCVFHHRCPVAIDECAVAAVDLAKVGGTQHTVACIRADEMPALSQEAGSCS